MYDLAPMILKGLSMSNIWVLDEIDCRLHPRIVELIIRLFHDSVINGKNPQLIFTSHNTALMNSDLFRRDQIWFVQKENSGATNLTCLDEYNSEQVRANTNFEKWYRDGRFDAIPEIQYATLRSTIKDMAEKESDGESSNE
jgi:AAA15 family ATPase/GTPase